MTGRRPLPRLVREGFWAGIRAGHGGGGCGGERVASEQDHPVDDEKYAGGGELAEDHPEQMLGDQPDRDGGAR